MGVKAKQVTEDEWADHLNSIPNLHATESRVDVMAHRDASGKAHGAVIYTSPKVYIILEYEEDILDSVDPSWAGDDDA